ncbi:MAG: voltage-gated chloride channel family protein [Cryomorphaceae bacterium]|nr:voltage-gated chloride channel family protein [Cryomorphaceae bacterium]
MKKKHPFYFWSLLTIIIGILSGAASSLFLHLLHWATDFRTDRTWMVLGLPAAGLLIGWAYYRYGQDVVKGNDQIIDEYKKPNKIIPLKMAPMVLLGTVITHLFGGSAGREGTAVQMGSSIADQFSEKFSLKAHHRRLILMMGMSGGFASVFGTPWAAAIFAFEVLRYDSFKWIRITPIVFAAFIAHYTCLLLGVHHTQYAVDWAPSLHLTSIGWAILAGIFCGFSAMLFSQSNHFFKSQFNRWIKNPMFRPVVGGAILALVFWFSGLDRFMGLGVPVIESAFHEQLSPFDFLIKTIFTAFTLGAGFKGGEVTPLFFVGATLGNALSLFIPLPMALLAGMCFIAVFAGATNTPIACTVMGLELFGPSGGLFFLIACVVSYVFSGQPGIYNAQPTMPFKIPFGRFKKSMR